MERNKRRIGLAGVAAGLVVTGVVVAPQAFGGTQAAGCADVQIIATRASTERPGAGIIGTLVTAVESASKRSISTATTDYPATLSNYAASESKGVAALKQLAEAAVRQCPAQQLVLMGYSQGAQVTGDVLAGGTAAAKNVAAVILMGDPAFVPGKSFNAGTSTRAGVFPRRAARSLDAFAARIQSYCDTGDNFCAGGTSLAVHLGYTRKYNGAAEKFVLAKIGG